MIKNLILSLGFLCLSFTAAFAQTTWGNNGSRTEIRDDASLQGNQGAISGFYETAHPVNYPSGAASWWHLLDVRHSNVNNIYAMQFAGSFYDQKLWFRKTDNSSTQGWSRVIMERDNAASIDSRLGIGLASPETRLHINSTTDLDGIKLSHQNGRFASIYTPSLVPGGMNHISQSGDAGIIYGQSLPDAVQFGFVIAPWRNSITGLRMDKDGNIGIATGDTKGYRLAVNGDAIFTKVKLKQYGAWPDYVFEGGYLLRPLSELEAFIKDNKHLPEVPSAAEMEKNGLDVGENQALLLKKIEELTLYIIEQNKKTEPLATEVDALKKTGKPAAGPEPVKTDINFYSTK
jgi:hypothetical protein